MRLKKINQLILIVCLIMTLTNCKTYQYGYGPADSSSPARISSAFKYLKLDEAFLMFTKNYNNSPVKVFENNQIIFDSIMTTDDRNISNVLKVKITSEIKIQFKDIKKDLIISKEQMKNYKFIYIEKRGKRIFVDFNNGSKDLNSIFKK